MKLSDRSLGWLRQLDGAAPSTDGRLGAALSVGLMARRTPAWTEPHVRILDRLIERHRGEPGASSGELLVLLGLRSALHPALRPGEAGGGDGSGSGGGGDARGEAGRHGGGPEGPSTSGELAEQVCQRWEAASADGLGDGGGFGSGRALDLAVDGLGLRLHDTINGTDLHLRAFAPWWDRIGPRLIEDAARLSDDPSTVLTLALLLAPQAADDARQLFESGLAALAEGRGLEPPPAIDFANALALLGSREWGLEGQARELASAIESSWGPTIDDLTGNAGTGEAHLLGPASAILAAADAIGTGQWSELFTEPVDPCPQVVGVDFPDVALFRAEWINGSLHVGQSPSSENGQRWTGFRLVGGEPRMWYLTGMDGATMDTAGSAVVVRVPQVRGELEFAPGSY